LVAFLASLSVAQECDRAGNCDQHEMCPKWKEQGECKDNAAYMKKHCPVSCELPATNSVQKPPCKNSSHRCKVWADLGECERNEVNMHQYCPQACGICEEQEPEKEQVPTSIEKDDNGCVNKHELCDFWAEKGECEANPKYMNNNCAKACNACRPKSQPLSASEAEIVKESGKYGTEQRAEGNGAESTLKRIRESLLYMMSEEVHNLPDSIQKSCQNRHDLCSFWASIGECENNQAYMQTNCAVACLSCSMIDLEARCPKIEDAKPALRPGDLNKMFERIVGMAPGNKTLTEEDRAALKQDNMTEFTVTVHSRPAEGAPDDVDIATDKSQPVWVITMDDFLTPEECDGMIQLGYEHGYKRSEDVGAMKFDGSHDSVKSERRTSENAWCSHRDGCRTKDLPQSIHERMAKVMQIDAENSEDLQVLKYEKGNFYRTHHDYIPHQRDRQCGPRILTFFLYLSDVEAGGGTDFPTLGLTVMPKKGRALLWPSVLNSAPMDKDGRTTHQAMDVEAGTKFAANGWIHMYDYITPQGLGCT